MVKEEMEKKISRGVLVGVIVCCIIGVVVVAAMAMGGGGRDADTDIEAVVIDDELGRARTQAEIDNEDDAIATVESVVEWTVDIHDPVMAAENSSNIVIARVDVIEGFGSYAEVAESYTMPYTYGKMTVLKNIKGDLPMDEELKFYRVGGVLSAEEYYTGLGEEFKDEYAEMNEDDPEAWAEKTRYILEGDITMKPGRVYLMYLTPDTMYEKDGEAYGIVLAQAGMREVRKGKNGEWEEVLNNFTGDWEKLSEVEGI